MQYTPYTIPLAIAGILVTGVAIYAWKNRNVRSAVPFAILSTAIAGWTVAYTFQLTAVDIEWKQLFANVQYIGIAIVPVAWLMFTVDFSTSVSWFNRGKTTLLMVIPGITIVFA